MNEGLLFLLTALGNAVINSIWQTGLLWLIVLAYARFQKDISPRQLSALCFVALLTGFLSFIATFCVSLIHPNTGMGLLRWMIHIPSQYPVTPYLAVIYIVLLAVPVIKFTTGIKTVFFLKRKGLDKVPGHLKIFLLDTVQYLGIKRKVQIFTSALISSPLTIGFLKPVILLPVAMISHLSVQQAQAVILHELAHIRSSDYLKNLITQIILAMLYFNPFAWLLVNMQNLEREKSADRWVMQFEYDSSMYAQTLLQLARQNLAATSRLAIPIAGKRSPLLERVEFILYRGKRRYPSVKDLFISCTLIAAMFTGSLLKSAQTNNPVPIVFAAKPVSIYTVPVIAGPMSEASLNNEPEADASTPGETVLTPAVAAAPEETIEEQNPEIQVIEFAEELAANAAPAFVGHTENMQPVLAEEEEKKVQGALQATKKIVVELSWKAIDHSLAETVTPQEKQALKDIYIQKAETANWEKHADMLRTHYQDINWDKAAQKLDLVIQNIAIDSIYNNYRQVLEQLSSYRKQLEKKADSPKDEIKALNHLVSQYKTALQKMDSLRSKKIVEL